jgi:hypothetical protein
MSNKPVKEKIHHEEHGEHGERKFTMKSMKVET